MMLNMKICKVSIFKSFKLDFIKYWNIKYLTPQSFMDTPLTDEQLKVLYIDNM